jgi:hypothetical protein
LGEECTLRVSENRRKQQWEPAAFFQLSLCRFLKRNTDELKIKIYSIIILVVIWYGCETWSLTLREERRLRVFENRVLRRIFGPKRDEVIEELRKLHNKELSDLYSLPNPVRVMQLRIIDRGM